MASRETRVIEIALPVAIDDSLNALVTVSGVSKRSLVCDALVAYLGPKGVLTPAGTAPVTPTLTRGTRRHK